MSSTLCRIRPTPQCVKYGEVTYALGAGLNADGKRECLRGDGIRSGTR
jgi:hypothetical protein